MNVAGHGGGVRNGDAGDLILENCTFKQNAAIFRGGGICSTGEQCRAELTNCVFSDNFCAEQGGGVLNEGATVLLNGCTFIGNSSLQKGGGINCANKSSTTLINCTFTANSAGKGGGIFIKDDNSVAMITNCSFSENTAGHSAGIAVNGNNDRVIVTDCNFIKNSASYEGGGFTGGAGVQLLNCTFIANSAERGGGAIVGGGLTATLIYGYPTVVNCIFRNNSASKNGGGISAGDCTLVDCTFEGNNAGEIGGGANFQTDSMGLISSEWKNCIFKDNKATHEGGGINISGSLKLTKCRFESNNAGELGGGGFIIGPSLPTFTQCIFTMNSAFNGGALYIEGENSHNISNCIFNSNSAVGSGGAIYRNTGKLIKSGLVNCTFTGNIAGTGAIMAHNNNNTYETSLVNCTITANVARDEYGLFFLIKEAQEYSHIDLHNCIVWDNHNSSDLSFAEQVQNLNVIISHCCIQEWTDLGRYDSNINADPMFVREPYDGGDGWADDPNTPDINEAANNDYGVLWLRPESPCINAGDSTALPADTLDLDSDEDIIEPIPIDLDSAQRILGHAVDIGAYEHHKDFIIHVDDDASGANNGSNWQNAYNHIFRMP